MRPVVRNLYYRRTYISLEKELKSESKFAPPPPQKKIPPNLPKTPKIEKTGPKLTIFFSRFLLLTIFEAILGYNFIHHTKVDIMR